MELINLTVFRVLWCFNPGQTPLELTLGKRKDKSKRHRRLMEKFISRVVSLFLTYFFSHYLTESDEHVETKV